jgi:hypothetical protein
MRSFYAEGQLETKDGEKLTLVCDFYTIDVVQGVTGENWDDILPRLFTGDRALFVKVLYGLLRKRHEEVTMDEAAAVSFDCDQVVLGATVMDVIRRACNLATGEEAKDKNPPQRRGRSKSSGKNG